MPDDAMQRGCTTVIVCGGRHFRDWRLVRTVLTNLAADRGPLRIVTGESFGADAHAKKWAVDMGAEYVGYPADWDSFGPAAGPIRNSEMVVAEDPDLVVAFPGGRGTANMIATARAQGIPVMEIGA